MTITLNHTVLTATHDEQVDASKNGTRIIEAGRMLLGAGLPRRPC